MIIEYIYLNLSLIKLVVLLIPHNFE